MSHYTSLLISTCLFQLVLFLTSLSFYHFCRHTSRNWWRNMLAPWGQGQVTMLSACTNVLLPQIHTNILTLYLKDDAFTSFLSCTSRPGRLRNPCTQAYRCTNTVTHIHIPLRLGKKNNHEALNEWVTWATMKERNGSKTSKWIEVKVNKQNNEVQLRENEGAIWGGWLKEG